MHFSLMELRVEPIYDRFNELVRYNRSDEPIDKYKKKRKCLKCGDDFISMDACNRICGACSFRNSKKNGINYYV